MSGALTISSWRRAPARPRTDRASRPARAGAGPRSAPDTCSGPRGPSSRVCPGARRRGARRTPREACGPRARPRTGRSSGSSAGAGSALSPPPGRWARSPATIALKPVKGSIRISGITHLGGAPRWSIKQLLHRDVLDSGLPEQSPPGSVSGALVELASIGLGVEHDPPRAAGPRLDVRRVEQRGRDPLPASGRREPQAG